MQDFNTKNMTMKKSLGQNFLINQGVLNKIVDAANLNINDVVVEIGPGTGNLTEKIAEKAGRVMAIEKDNRLIESLKEKFKDSNVEIVEGDALKIDTGVLLNSSRSKASGSYKIIGNIPYYITSHLLRTIFEKWLTPELIVLTIQKEVARRIVAKPPDMNLLALSVQLYSDPKIIGYVSKGSFRPMPKVDSAIIKLIPKNDIDPNQVTKILALAKKAFAGKRKKLKNTIGQEILKNFNIDPDTRPEKLSLNDWYRLK